MSDPNHVKSIFLAASEKPSAERAAFLDEAVAGDAALRARVEALLKAHDNQDNFLQDPAAKFGAAIDLSPAERPFTEGPGTIIGPYKLLQQIGEGGMGVVFMAEQTEPLLRTVALKIIKPGMDTRQVIARFEAERQALAMMDHPSIARVLDAGTTDTGRPYFVMDLVKGVPITEYCDAQHLTVRQRLELITQLCQAVQHAHQKGIIHRDLKPSNVLVAEYDGKPVPKIIDFGVAKATAQRLTERTMFTEYGQLIGTFEYMSPEQASFNQLDVDTRSDIYSLGVLLYEVLVGSTPVEKERLRSAAFDEVLRIICDEEPPRPSLRLSSLSLRESAGESVSTCSASIAANRSVEPKQLTNIIRGDLDWIVMKALEKDRTRRYDTAGNFAADVLRHLSDQPVEACPPSAIYRLKKFARRHKIAIWTSAVVTVALIAGTIASTGQAIRATRAERELKNVNDRLAAQLTRAESAEKMATDRAHQLSQQLYEINLTRAVAAFRDGQSVIASKYLNECPETERGWEWQWVVRQVPLDAPVEIRGRQLPQFTPDGHQILAVDVTDQRSVKFWNASSGIEERAMAHSETPIKQVLLSQHGQLLATGLEDGTISMWSIESGGRIWSVKAHDQRTDGFAFSPDGTRLASVSWDCTLKVLNVNDGTELLSARTDYQLRSVSYSPDGSRLVTGRRNWLPTDSTPSQVWNALTGDPILELTGASPRSATYSPDGKCIATGGNDGVVRVYDSQSGERIRSWTIGAAMFISGLAFSPDGSQLVTSAGDNTLRLWDARTGKRLAVFRGHDDVVDFVSISQDGRRVVSVDRGYKIYVWDMGAVDYFTAAPAESAASLAFSPNGRHIVFGADTHVTILNSDTLVEERIIPFPICRQTAFSPDGTQLVSSSDDGSIVFLNSANGDITKRFGRHPGGVEFVTYSPDGSRLASSAADAMIRLWNVNTGQLLHTLQGHDTAGGAIREVAFRHDGKQLASVARDGLCIWDAESGSLLRRIRTNVGLASVAYSPDGSSIVAGGNDRLLHVWDAQSGDALRNFSGGHAHNNVLGVSFSPDASRLVSCDEAGMIRIWNPKTGIPLLTLCEADDVAACRIRFSPDGKSIVAAKRDGRLLAWDIEPSSDGYVSRRRAQAASRVAREALEQHHWLQEAVVTIQADPLLEPALKRLALQLTQIRLAAAPLIAKGRLELLRRTVTAPDVEPHLLDAYARKLLMIQPASIRDAAAALPIAQKAVDMTSGTDAMFLDTLAEAHFQNGQVAKAVEMQQRAVDLLSPEYANRLDYVERLERFKAAHAESQGNRLPDGEQSRLQRGPEQIPATDEAPQLKKPRPISPTSSGN